MHEGPGANGLDPRGGAGSDGNGCRVLAQKNQGIRQAVRRHIEQAVRRFGRSSEPLLSELPLREQIGNVGRGKMSTNSFSHLWTQAYNGT